MSHKKNLALGALILSALSVPIFATPTTMKDSYTPRDTYAPYNDDTFPNNVYFGDTHLHTSYSTDAGLFGATKGPDTAAISFFAHDVKDTITVIIMSASMRFISPPLVVIINNQNR